MYIFTDLLLWFIMLYIYIYMSNPQQKLNIFALIDLLSLTNKYSKTANCPQTETMMRTSF